MTEQFDKIKYFEDTDAALRADDPKIADNDNAKLIENLSEEEQANLLEDMIIFLEDSQEKEACDNVKDMISYIRMMTATYKLTKLLEDSVDEESEEDEKAEEAAEVNAVEATEEVVETYEEADAEGKSTSTQEA